jgi:hypothetical protein
MLSPVHVLLPLPPLTHVMRCAVHLLLLQLLPQPLPLLQRHGCPSRLR